LEVINIDDFGQIFEVFSKTQAADLASSSVLKDLMYVINFLSLSQIHPTTILNKVQEVHGLILGLALYFSNAKSWSCLLFHFLLL